MTELNLDHVVHYVNDLDQAIQTFKEHGLIAFKGGSHKDWGTYNALSYFGLTYIEFLAIEDRELAVSIQDPNRVVKDAVLTLPDHEAFSRIAIRTTNIDDVAVKLKAHGLQTSPVMNGKRLDQLGELIEWRMMTIDGDFQGLAYPFFIQWKGTDAERLERLTESGVIRPHPSGEAAIQSAVFSVSDPEAAAGHWQQLFALPIVESGKQSVTLGIGDKFLILKKGKENRMTQLQFKTNARSLSGKNITIGEAEYVF